MAPIVKDKIELLSLSHLSDREKLNEIDRWLNVFNWPNGWHYDLDIIWILQHIESLQLKKGATIMDAGAGLGMLQFILAARGYRVISLDFTDRLIPKFSKGIFDIDVVDSNLGDYQHDYMTFMTYGQSHESGVIIWIRFVYVLLKLLIRLFVYSLIFNLKGWRRCAYLIRSHFRKHFNPVYTAEKKQSHDSFGAITFLRGTFNNIPYNDDTIDALVSVSAFEHNSYDDMPGSISEFTRVLKPGAPMLITTSATDQPDWFFEPSKGWNFSEDTLRKWFDIHQVQFDFARTLALCKTSSVLHDRLHNFYKFNGQNGLPYGDFSTIQYVPVGILKFKA